MERPAVKWKVVAQVGGVFVVLWGLSLGLVPWISYWGVGATGILSLVAIGFGIYIWRLTRKSQAIVDILKNATDDEGRMAALAKLGEGKAGDAMKNLARAQLLARDDPPEAIRVLESIDLKKAPAVVQDDVRANLALMYLMNNRTRDARELADEIRLDRQPQPKAKAMYAAVVAESFARTGNSDEAKKLLETYDSEDPEYGEMRAMLYRAQVFTYMSTKNRGLAKSAMQKLGALDPNMVAAFAVKASNPELAKMARQVLQSAGAIPKQKVKMLRR